VELSRTLSRPTPFTTTALCCLAVAWCFTLCPAESAPSPLARWDRSVALSLIRMYQRNISPKSVKRCPFNISCSQFATRSIERHGLVLGLVRFVDRFCFREHTAASLYYPLAVSSDGALRLDDAFFLDPEPPPASSASAADSVPLARPGAGAPPDRRPDSRIAWADELFRQQDYSNAGTVYKECEFFAPDDSTRKRCEFQTARSYLGAGEFRLASIWVAHYLSEQLNPEQRARALVLTGEICAGQKLYAVAALRFADATPPDSQNLAGIYHAWMQAECGNWTAAQTEFDRAATRLAPADPRRQSLTSWSERADAATHLPRTSPAVAAIASAILPGAGQFYSGHAVDAAQAFVYVASFGLATWAAYRYESSFHQPRIGTSLGILATGTIYLSNIWGAHRTAQYRNLRRQEECLEPIRRDAPKLEFTLPPP
jgi:hypothetical protein